MPLWTSVLFCGCAPRFSPGQPKCYNQMKELDRTTNIYTGIAGVNGRWGQVVEETACCHLAPGETWKVTLNNWQCGAYLSTIYFCMSAVKYSNWRQPIIHSSHHVLETFRPFLVKVTRAAQSDFGLVQLQVNRKLLLNWMCKGIGSVTQQVQCNWCNPISLLWAIEQTRKMTLASWQHGVWALGMFAWLELGMCEVRHHCQPFQRCRVLYSASWHKAC